ncbi:MAG TPA: hypothetical protein VEB22_00680 [Phycisphaerales bacterium]|nr:hypothetical protein [Phycisphaerales bacterium]
MRLVVIALVVAACGGVDRKNDSAMASPKPTPTKAPAVPTIPLPSFAIPSPSPSPSASPTASIRPPTSAFPSPSAAPSATPSYSLVYDWKSGREYAKPGTQCSAKTNDFRERTTTLPITQAEYLALLARTDCRKTSATEVVCPYDDNCASTRIACEYTTTINGQTVKNNPGISVLICRDEPPT